MPKLTSNNTRTERRYANIQGSSEEPITLADLKGFIAAADQAGVPDETVVVAPGPFGLTNMPLLHLRVSAEVTV